jgi:dehydrogenase/reductase SDR family member 7B
LILVARSTDKLELLCKELEQQKFIKNAHKPTFCHLDITELCNLEEGNLKNKILNLTSHSINGKNIDVLVCCAGLSNRGSIDKTHVSIFRQLFEVFYLLKKIFLIFYHNQVNFFGFVYLVKYLLNFIPNDGAIISINSIQGRVALPYRAPYSCSKHASQAFFDSLRGEERPELHILTVNAGYINVRIFCYLIIINPEVFIIIF